MYAGGGRNKNERMEILTIITTALVISFFPLKTGFVAKDFGRNFWLWFFMGLFMPFVSVVILLCLPIKGLELSKKEKNMTQLNSDQHDDVIFIFKNKTNIKSLKNNNQWQN